MELFIVIQLLAACFAIGYFAQPFLSGFDADRGETRKITTVLLICFIVSAISGAVALVDASNKVSVAEAEMYAAVQEAESLEIEVESLHEQYSNLDEYCNNLTKRKAAIQKELDKEREKSKQYSSEIKSLRETINNLKAESNRAKQNTTESYQSGYSGSTKHQNSYTQTTQETYQEQAVTYVLVTRTGSKYHLKKCGNGTYYQATLDDALARGLDPCSKCF